MRTKETRAEIKRLSEDALALLELLNVGEEGATDRLKFRIEYQRWYSVALPFVEQMAPHRAKEVKSYYLDENRKKLDLETYGIFDFLNGISPNYPADFDWERYALDRLLSQHAIVGSLLSVLDSTLVDLKATLSADLFDSELDAASELLTKGFLRAAGALAGVVVERHLAAVCASHGLKTRKTKPTISVWNDLLKEASVIDVKQWRRIQLLADVRNHCAHNSATEPTDEEVAELIRGTNALIKTVH